MRGPQTIVHEILWKPAHYQRRLQYYPRSRGSPKWDGWSRPRLGAAPAFISPLWPLGDGAGGPTIHVEGPHLPITPRPISLFDRDARALAIGRGDLPPMPPIRSPPSFGVLASRDGEAALFLTRSLVAA